MVCLFSLSLKNLSFGVFVFSHSKILSLLLLNLLLRREKWMHEKPRWFTKELIARIPLAVLSKDMKEEVFLNDVDGKKRMKLRLKANKLVNFFKKKNKESADAVAAAASAVAPKK
jgi:hypothetical protein